MLKLLFSSSRQLYKSGFDLCLTLLLHFDESFRDTVIWLRLAVGAPLLFRANYEFRRRAAAAMFPFGAQIYKEVLDRGKIYSAVIVELSIGLHYT